MAYCPDSDLTDYRRPRITIWRIIAIFYSILAILGTTWIYLTKDPFTNLELIALTYFAVSALGLIFSYLFIRKPHD